MGGHFTQNAKCTWMELGLNVMFQDLKSLKSTFEAQERKVLISALLAISCVTLGMLLPFSGPQFSNLEHKCLD